MTKVKAEHWKFMVTAKVRCPFELHYFFISLPYRDGAMVWQNRQNANNILHVRIARRQIILGIMGQQELGGSCVQSYQR